MPDEEIRTYTGLYSGLQLAQPQSGAWRRSQEKGLVNVQVKHRGTWSSWLMDYVSEVVVKAE